MNYDIEAIASSYSLKRPNDSEIYQYPIVPHGTICPRCKEGVVEYDKKRIDIRILAINPMSTFSDRVCDGCKYTIDEDDFGKVDVEEYFEDDGEPGMERIVLYLKNGETIVL